ncbi:MAG: glycosyltransferase family 4 protein [SAR202 cluster bacterium]|nr:glycosyltransferase family 4 protein [SAR202 cluster bacterium]|tara:strand:+ start:1029 stop:2141 length:1113 start_codon:yes stop_codon:yes gene_type:complete
MKIAQVSPYDLNYPGGVVSHMFQLGEHLINRGHEVKYIGPINSTNNNYSNQIIPIGNSIPIPVSGSIARISLNFWGTKKIKKILDKEKFDIIHLHEPLMPSLPLKILSHSTSVNIGTFHAYNDKDNAYKFTKWYLTKFINRLSSKITVSASAKEYVQKHFPGEYTVIPNGIDLDFLSQKSNPLDKYRDNKFNILFLGRLEKRKGLKYLLQAYIELKKKYAIRLIIIGPGNLDKDCVNIIKSINSTDIVCTGPITDQYEKRMYYQTADLFCAPNTGNESFGIVLTEAMACGTPVIASNINGFKNVIEHGKNGFLFEPNSVSSIYQCIEKLINNNDLRKSIAQNGKYRVRQYNWNILVDKILDCYEKAQNGL